MVPNLARCFAPAGINRDTGAPGLHHFCFRVESVDDLRLLAVKLRDAGIEAAEPRLHPEYAPDYHASFVPDPVGLRREITNFRHERRQRHGHWDQT